MNVHGEEAMGRRVPVERTHVERQTIHMYERREKKHGGPNNKDRVPAFIRLFFVVYGLCGEWTPPGTSTPSDHQNVEQDSGQAHHPLYLLPTCLDHGRGPMADVAGPI